MSTTQSRISLPVWQERFAAPFAPTTAAEMAARGWDFVDVVFVTGDAYVDHPSFAMAILHRVLERAGFRVAILSQPEWKTCEPWRQFGRPRLFFAISAGNMDSLINHYTANKKVRNDDAYSPGGKIGLRPDRATLPYCQRAREAFPGVPVIAGGVEASLRRLAHYDYWSDSVKRSILLDSKADLVVYGMGEQSILTIAQKLKAGGTLRDLRAMRGVAYAMGAKESEAWMAQQQAADGADGAALSIIPSFEQVRDDKWAFAEATRLIHTNTNPFNAATLVQFHDRQAVVQNPPALPLSQQEIDAVYDLPYNRRPHPSYKESVPAHEMIKDSVTILRGCFGGCTFCSITAHQGRIIQSRSSESVMKEVQKLAADPDFKGIISDIGGATANMYTMRCSRPEVEAKCKRLSCVHPGVCKLLGTDHGPLIDLMREVRNVDGVRKVLVSSGIRMDLAQLSPEYVRELAEHHTGGRLKVAPEHASPKVLELMKKPSIDNFGVFADQFRQASADAGKPKQQIIPYFIASHPGCDLDEMIDLALYLKQNGYRPDQVQDFIPAPFDIATCMYYAGLDPFTKKPVNTARNLNDRKLQRALMQFFKPENYFEVREALIKAGRADLIGGCDGLIPAQPPKEAIESRRKQANAAARNDHYHSVANPAKGEQPGERPVPPQVKNKGYRPGRNSASRKNRGPGKPPPK
ncbi:YgiQ family radical SAM protein [Gemmata sp. G18]|uniref:YgiQ family radical SAM protein n=1 Tax=Gemmata palustris TaxID=2822762 RepID=A0ABS5BR32_9BACT|nr:YgiQ family radical SAM protein [Gemmata palustris]MBP3956138.1 YgiQ family radical SAM protein [Gemmata palustris]